MIKKAKFKLSTPIPHKVTLKSIHKGLCAPSPHRAIVYIDRELDGCIIVNKQRKGSITITIYCSNAQYERMKVCFIKDMGEDFIWKD